MRVYRYSELPIANCLLPVSERNHFRTDKSFLNWKVDSSNLTVWSVVCCLWSNVTRTVLLTMIFTLFLLSPRAQVQWNLDRDENGIKVYSAPGESSKFKKIKVEASFPGSIAKLKAILLDVNNNKQWVYHTRQSHLLERVNENEVLYYAETSLPWPLSNRDVAIRMSFYYDSTSGDLIVTAVGVPDAVPVNNGIVRIKDFHARWEVKPLDINQIAITYYLVESAGSIPQVFQICS